MLKCLAGLLAAFLLHAVQAHAFDHQHRLWGALLSKHVVVSEGGNTSRVRYAGMAAERKRVQMYLDTLAAVPESDFQQWTRLQQLAFLINAYNTATVEKVLTRYPDIKSIRDFGRVFGNPFKDRFIRLLGREMSLDDIEHGLIRAEGAYEDPRIHFALNCAAVSCPMLREEAYVAARLDEQLEDQTVRFLSDRTRNRYEPATRTLAVSKIFDASPWYGGDFQRGWKGYRSLEQFFARHAAVLAGAAADRQVIEERRAAIRFLDYDWKLNDVGR